MNSAKVGQTRRVLRQFVHELAWVGFVLRRRVKSKALGLSRLFVRSRWPDNPDGKVLIHLGCGDVNSPEFINVDARPAPHVHCVRDVCDLSIFPDNYADLVYACHVLEHIRRAAIKKTLWEWRRLLKPGGVLRLSVPDFDELVTIYHACDNSIDAIMAPLLGGQDYAQNVHYVAFNKDYLTRLLKEAGFRTVREWDPRRVEYHAFEDWASRTIERDGRQYRVSLNLEAIR